MTYNGDDRRGVIGVVDVTEMMVDKFPEFGHIHVVVILFCAKDLL